MYVSTCWLSVYDVSISTKHLFDAYVVLYFGFLSKDDKALYQSRLDTVYRRHNVSESSKKEITGFHNTLSRKKLTEDGQKQKKRIYEKIFYSRKKTLLYLSLYGAALQSLKMYVKVFQQEEPAVYKLHDSQIQVFREFLSNFIKPEVLAANSNIRKLLSIDYQDPPNHLQNDLVFVGSDALKIIKKSRKSDPIIKEFLNKGSVQAYSICATYTVKTNSAPK